MTIDELIELINHTVYENEDGDITGESMNIVLNAIVATIGVEANPEDEATGTLNKIKIGEVVFDVEGGGGTVDPYPTDGSTNPVQSGGVYEALETLIPRASLFGGFITATSTPNPDDSRRYYLTNQHGDLPNFDLYNLPDDGKWKHIHWNPRDAAWDWETIDCYTSAQIDKILSDVANAISGKQNTISDLAAIRSGAAAGAAASTRVAEINDMIPAQASASNQLADKNFVNSSITTSTANFVGTFSSLAELQAVQNPTNNDYGFVIETDAQGNQYYDRYKYNGTTWLFEYKVESTAFTAAQWAAIQSGITAGLVNRLGVIIPAGATSQNPLATVGDIPTIPTIPVVDASTIPPASMDADKVYQYGTLLGDTTFPALNAPTDLTVAHVFCWTFTTPATAPTITWPSAITSWAGGSAPTINASKSYEVSVMDGFATIIEN